jgi:hypothetical protein
MYACMYVWMGGKKGRDAWHVRKKEEKSKKWERFE